jgi:hypothetical protein
VSYEVLEIIQLPYLRLDLSTTAPLLETILNPATYSSIAEMFVSDNGPYKFLEELWDGDV